MSRKTVLRSALLGFALFAAAGCAQSMAPSSGAAAPVSPLAQSSALMYVSDLNSRVLVFSYPQVHQVGVLTGFYRPSGECADSAGDVFVVSVSPAGVTWIFEYAHGGSSPIITLTDPGTGYACAFDSKTGNLAVTNTIDYSNHDNAYGDVAIFPHGKGPPVMYRSPDYGAFYNCGYDKAGNLYAAVFTQSGDGPQLTRLPKGISAFDPIKLDVALHSNSFGFQPSVQWDGKHMTVSTLGASSDVKIRARRNTGPLTIYQLSISGKKATAIGKTVLKGADDRFFGQSLIDGKAVLAIDYIKGFGHVGVWRYPAGGMPTRYTRGVAGSDVNLFGLAVSR